MNLNAVLDVPREQRNPQASPRASSILLLSVPGLAQGWSPLGIARLKAYLRAHGLRADTLPLCVLFTNHLRRHAPHFLALDAEIAEFGTTWHELFYAGLLFGHATPDDLILQSVLDRRSNVDVYRTYLDYRGGRKRVPDLRAVADDARRIRRFCAMLHSYLGEILDHINWTAYDAIGFSCLDAQFLTSLYLAKEIRRRHGKNPLIVFGGEFFQSYNTAQILENFSEIDYIVVGQAEETLTDLLVHVTNEKEWPRLSGTMPDRGACRYHRKRADRIDEFPAPDYTELRRCRGTKYALSISLGAGCTNSGCSFCPICSTGHHLRPLTTVLEEVRQLRAVHGLCDIDFVDWEINGDPDYLAEFCSLAIKNRFQLASWGEVNARNTSPALLAGMRAAGIRRVQVGIESFSEETLRLIGKRASVVDNVKVLKWSIEAGLDHVLFNIMCNHPLASNEDPRENLRVMHLIEHLLRRPVCAVLNEVNLYRTSRMYCRAEHFRLGNVREFDFSWRLYPPHRLSREVPLFCVAYDAKPVAAAWRRVEALLRRLTLYPVTLTARKLRNGMTLIHDSRNSRKQQYQLGTLEGRVLWEAMDQTPSVQAIAASVGEPVDRVDATVDRLVRRKLVIRSKAQVLALPLRAGISSLGAARRVK